MAPVAAKTSQKAGDAPKAPASASRVDEFFAFIDQYCAQEKYKELRATIRKVDGLQEEIGSLRIAYKENLAEHAQLRNEFNADKLSYEQRLEHEKNRYDQVLKDKEAAERAVKAEKSNCAKLKSDILSRDEDIKRLTHTVKKHETQVAKLDNKYKAQAAELDKANGQGVQLSAELREMKAKVTTQSEELVNTRQDLEKVQSFIVPLANLEDVRDQVCASLNAAFSQALAFFQSFFERDFDEVLLDNRKAWDKIRDLPSMYRVPLPASNSHHAKRMRVIAALVIYAQALSRHVFRPTYIIQNNYDDIDQILDTLARESPLQEAYVRAVLLRASSDSREVHRETCSTIVASDVTGAMAGWLSANQREGFHTAVKRLSDDACQGWKRVQHLADRVRPSFMFELSEDWQSLPSTPPTTVQNGMAHEEELPALREVEGRQTTDERHTQRHAGRPNLVEKSEVISIIWPAFFASNPSQTDDEALDRLHCGYVLTRAEVEDAEVEISEESRRTSRKTHRKNDSIPRRQRQGSLGFLSIGGSGGQEEK